MSAPNSNGRWKVISVSTSRLWDMMPAHFKMISAQIIFALIARTLSGIRLKTQPRSQGLSPNRPLSSPQRAVRWETLGTRLLKTLPTLTSLKKINFQTFYGHLKGIGPFHHLNFKFSSFNWSNAWIFNILVLYDRCIFENLSIFLIFNTSSFFL